MTHASLIRLPLAALLSLFFVASLAAPALAADKCKNVKLTVKNATSDTLKVKKFEYYDFDKKKWRTEALFGVDGHQKINAGKSWQKTRSLEHVDDDKIKIRVTYQHQIGGTKWESNKSVTTGSFVCKDNMSRTIRLDK